MSSILREGSVSLEDSNGSGNGSEGDAPTLVNLSGSIQRRQTLPMPGPLAGFAAFGKFPARGGAPFVDAAQGLFTGFAVQRGAAGRAVVGAAHAAGVLGHRSGQALGHRAATFFIFKD